MRVVAAAVLRDGQVLAARRAQPPSLAGGWEFPGGKVETDEDDADALVRELQEELGVTVRVRRRLGEVDLDDLQLVLYAATLRDGEPQPGADHDELRWLEAASLGSVEWLPADRTLLPAVLDQLG